MRSPEADSLAFDDPKIDKPGVHNWHRLECDWLLGMLGRNAVSLCF